MRKLLIPVIVIASLLLGACSGDPIVNRLPWVYRLDIQQGNVIQQDVLNQVRLGMNKRQVQFVLGTPLLADPFHADRWDYYYQYAPGTDGEGEPDKQRVSLFFEDDKLTRMAGSMEPQPAGTGDAPARQLTVTVPPQEIEEAGVLTRMWRWIGFGGEEEYRAPAATSAGDDDEPGPGAPTVY